MKKSENQKPVKTDPSRKGPRRETAGNRRINREILTFAYLFLFVFAAFVGYFAWFQVSQSETVANNTYNKRVEALVNRTLRGRILSSDGTVLAESVLEADATQRR